MQVEKLTVSKVTSENIPRIEHLGVHWSRKRIGVPDLKRQRIFNFVGQANKVQRHEPVYSIGLAHGLHQLGNRFSFAGQRKD